MNRNLFWSAIGCIVLMAVAFMAMLVLSLLLTDCTSLAKTGNVISGHAVEENPIGSLYAYRGELDIKVAGVHYEGMAVAKLTGPITIHVESKFGLDRLQFTSCARQDVVRDVGQSWFGKSKSYDYQYVPNKTEMGGQCPLYIEAFNKQNLASWGYVAFQSDETLPADMQCNGTDQFYPGFSVCQTLAGLDQAISFAVPVKDFEADPGCAAKRTSDRSFTLRPGLGMCTASFYDGSNWHSLNLLGYQRVLVQE